MKVSDLKEICKLMSAGRLIDSINMKDNKIIGVDAGKTFIAEMEYQPSLIIPQDICIENISGVKEIADKFSDNVEINTDNGLNFAEGKTDYHIPLKPAIELGFNLPQFTKDNYDVILENIDHNIFRNLGKLRVDSMINELYYLFIDDSGNLVMRAGEKNEAYGNSIIEHAIKSKQGFIIKFTMNISECFKNILTNANIYIIADKILIVECVTERYTIKYYLAPRVDS